MMMITPGVVKGLKDLVEKALFSITVGSYLHHYFIVARFVALVCTKLYVYLFIRRGRAAIQRNCLKAELRGVKRNDEPHHALLVSECVLPCARQFWRSQCCWL
jgi:hypothetical protein